MKIQHISAVTLAVQDMAQSVDLLAFNFLQVYYLGKAPLIHSTWEGCHAQLATFVILLAMSPVLLVLVVVSTTYLLSVLVAIIE